MTMNRLIFSFACLAIGATGALAGTAKTAPAALSRSPCLGAIAIDAATGAVLKEDRADERGHPASMLKLMTLCVILDAVKAGEIALADPVKINAEVSRIGGSQVYLAENEEFTVEELVYAMMIQSANDAALALALHTAGSRDAFIERMNRKARKLRLDRTVFHSIHGLPPGEGQNADWTTARDFARLCQSLIAEHPETLTYTSTQERTFRPSKPFIMRTHNQLLKSLPGCDGLKTGYYRMAGYSIAATASREGARAIVVILGSVDRKERDARAQAWLTESLAQIRAAQAAAVTATPAPPALPVPAPAAP